MRSDTRAAAAPAGSAANPVSAAPAAPPRRDWATLARLLPYPGDRKSVV